MAKKKQQHSKSEKSNSKKDRSPVSSTDPQSEKKKETVTVVTMRPRGPKDDVSECLETLRLYAVPGHVFGHQGNFLERKPGGQSHENQLAGKAARDLIEKMERKGYR